jgi:hypothetical protein
VRTTLISTTVAMAARPGPIKDDQSVNAVMTNPTMQMPKEPRMMSRSETERAVLVAVTERSSIVSGYLLGRVPGSAAWSGSATVCQDRAVAAAPQRCEVTRREDGASAPRDAPHESRQGVTRLQR